MASSQPRLASTELQACARDFRHAVDEARNLLTYTNEDALHQRPAPAAWPALERLAHWKWATEAMLPGIRQAIEQAPARSDDKQKYRLALAGRLLAWSLEPPVLLKLKAPKLAQPMESVGPEPTL